MKMEISLSKNYGRDGYLIRSKFMIGDYDGEKINRTYVDSIEEMICIAFIEEHYDFDFECNLDYRKNQFACALYKNKEVMDIFSRLGYIDGISRKCIDADWEELEECDKTYLYNIEWCKKTSFKEDFPDRLQSLVDYTISALDCEGCEMSLEEIEFIEIKGNVEHIISFNWELEEK